MHAKAVAYQTAIPRSMRTILETITTTLEDESTLAPSDCQAVAHALIRRLSHQFGGRTVYLPRGTRLAMFLRNATIVHDYRNGTPVRTLARTHGITTMRVYQVLAEQLGEGVRGE